MAASDSYGPARPDQWLNFKYKLIDYKGCMLHADFASVMPEVGELECLAEDILLCSFPKLGEITISQMPSINIDS